MAILLIGTIIRYGIFAFIAEVLVIYYLIEAQNKMKERYHKGRQSEAKEKS